MSNELIAKIRTGMRGTLVSLDWWREKPCGIRVKIDKEIDGSPRTRSRQLTKAELDAAETPAELIEKTALELTEKIEVKKRKIQKLFRELPPEKKQFADGLIYQFAVTTVTLERLVEEINRGELIEDFVQGAQQLRRENPALKSYNATIKSFTALSKSLLDLLPEKTQKQAGEELLSFATKPPGAGRK